MHFLTTNSFMSARWVAADVRYQDIGSPRVDERSAVGPAPARGST
jgi:hypothetical protein